MREVDGLSIHEIVRRTGHDRNTVRPSKLDPFEDEIKRLLQDDPRIPGKRIRELIEALGYEGGKTIRRVLRRAQGRLADPRGA